MLAAASVVVALPWALPSLLAGLHQEAPLRLAPLVLVRSAIALNPSLGGLARSLAGGGGSPLNDLLALAVLTLVFVAGGLGVRLVGLPWLWQGARRDESGFGAWLAGTVAVAIALGLLVEGNPVSVEGMQFLLFAQALSWIPAGVVLAEATAGPGRRRAAAMALVAVALVGPCRYLARKAWPEFLTPASAADRLRFTVSPTTLAACAWLARQPARTDRLVVALAGDPEDMGGLLALHLGALAERRVVASNGEYHVGTAVADRQRALVDRLYSTPDAGEGERLLAVLGASWVWEDARHPLRFSAPWLVLRFTAGPTRVYQVVRGPYGGAGT